MRMDARTSDAVALALRMHAPIYVYEDILEDEGIRSDFFSEAPLQDEQPKEENIESLKAALAEAIANENYERAAQLRDQINQRKRCRHLSAITYNITFRTCTYSTHQTYKTVTNCLKKKQLMRYGYCVFKQATK